jgi:hypothetical protein
LAGFSRNDKGLRGGGARFPRAGTGSFSSASREFPGVSREIVKPPYVPLAVSVLLRTRVSDITAAIFGLLPP